MKRIICSLLTASALVLALVSCATSAAHQRAWEYKVVWINNTAEAQQQQILDELGKQGWELADHADRTFYLKRPVQ